MDLTTSFKQVNERIRAACLRAGRDPATVRLVAVSKGHPASAVAEAVRLGQRCFGENRVQEASAKIPLCPAEAEWHMIGHLQTNKAREAVRCFGMIQSVDSLRLAGEINKWCERAGKTMPILLEVNVGGEQTKHGYAPEAVLAEIAAIRALPRLELRGLMTVPPYAEDPETVRPVFQALRELRGRCQERLGIPLPELSMGMSGDFEVAIEEGASWIRLGTLLFGPR